MTLIKKLQECLTMGQADPILTRIGAGSAVKKLVETALALSNSSDPQQRNHAYSFMESAIKELEDGGEGNKADPGLTPAVDDCLDAPKISEEEKNEKEGKLHEEEGEKRHRESNHEDKEHKLHKEELDNHNQGQRTEGSEQSTDNTEPYPGQGVDTTTGEKPMQDMDDTVNQWSETNGMVVPGMPPTPEMMGAPGLDPSIAQELGQNMPAPPPLNNNQMMRQMQYTIQQEMKNYNIKVVAPMIRYIKQQKEAIDNQRQTLIKQANAIKQLSLEVSETKTNSGNMKLDLDALRQNATAKFRETEPVLDGFAGTSDGAQAMVGVQPLPNYKRNKIAEARSEIESMDRMLNSQKNPMYK